MNLPNGCIILSTCAFTLGRLGVHGLKSILKVSIYLETSSLFIGGPLSTFNLTGMSNIAKILSIFSITDEALVDRTISTAGYLEYVSISTSRYSPLSRRPTKKVDLNCFP